MRLVYVLLLSLALFGCVDEPASVPGPEAAAFQYCASDCYCPQGSQCDHATSQCEGMVDFSPPAPYALAGATCQCDYGQASDGFYCIPAGGGGCSSNCDCPRGTVCNGGQCEADFGPYPECHCDNHCGDGEYCSGNVCVYGGGGGGGGGAGGGGGGWYDPR